jgi:hypothetical protein
MVLREKSQDRTTDQIDGLEAVVTEKGAIKKPPALESISIAARAAEVSAPPWTKVLSSLSVSKTATPRRWTAALIDLHHSLLDVLDQIEPPTPREKLGARLSRLEGQEKIPSHVITLMHVIVKFRNMKEHQNRSFVPTNSEAFAVKFASLAIGEWAKSEGYATEIEQWEPPT